MTESLKELMLDAALPHVAFDGWGTITFSAVCQELNLSESDAYAVCPRGAVDLAVAYHQRGDRLMRERIDAMDASGMRYSERVAACVRFRIEAVDDKELVRRGMTLFAMPRNAGDAARLIWGTADQIWTALGDTSDDINWYSKRAILSGVYTATVLFWLGDTTPGHSATWSFLDRRIQEVMQFEKAKSQARKTPILNKLMGLQDALFSTVKAPSSWPRSDLPGRNTRDTPPQS